MAGFDELLIKSCWTKGLHSFQAVGQRPLCSLHLSLSIGQLKTQQLLPSEWASQEEPEKV